VDLSKHAFFEGKIVPLADAKINIATHGFLYGTAVFGGMRAYWNDEKKRLFLFRPYDHFHRLLNSGRMMAMNVEYDEESLIQLTLDRQTPPTFLLQAEDDHVDSVYDSLAYYIALKKAGVPVEMHLYAQGGHAFGLRRTKFPITGWPQLVETWLGTIGMIPE